MGKKKSSAPGYYETKYDTGGLFGTTTSNKKGISYEGNEAINKAGATSWQGLNTALQNMASNDYANDPNFQAYQNQMNNAMEQNYDATVLSNLANRGLMRSSGLQSATNSFANTLADQTVGLYDNYYNRQANNLSNYQNTLNNLYNYMTGINTLAANQGNALNKYNLQAQMYNNANQGSGALAGGLSGAMAGAQAGSAAGPWGALAGAVIGGVGGAMANK